MVPAVVQQAAVDPQRVACRSLAAAVVRLWFLEGLISAPALEEPAVSAKATADRRRAACRLLATAVVRRTQTARCISFRPCRARGGAGFCGQYASRKATQCDLGHRRRIGRNPGGPACALGERCCRRPCRGCRYRTDTQIGDGVWS